jgi:hypothetical protein
MHFCTYSLIQCKLPLLLAHLLDGEIVMHSDLRDAFFHLCIVVEVSLRGRRKLRRRTDDNEERGRQVGQTEKKAGTQERCDHL